MPLIENTICGRNPGHIGAAPCSPRCNDPRFVDLFDQRRQPLRASRAEGERAGLPFRLTPVAVGLAGSESCSNTTLPASLLRALARRAGVHIYNDRDDTFYASRSYLCLNADDAAERTLRFPSPARLFDPLTGQAVTRQTTEFSHRFADRETLLMRYGR